MVKIIFVVNINYLRLMKELAETPKPPYYAVIFTSFLTTDQSDYSEMSNRMLELAAQQDGFLGVESAREILGITVSYWRDSEAIHRWKQNMEHSAARELGRKKWYESFRVRIAKVEREYEFEREGN